jgi:hypothetical protein
MRTVERVRTSEAEPTAASYARRRVHGKLRDERAPICPSFRTHGHPAFRIFPRSSLEETPTTGARRGEIMRAAVLSRCFAVFALGLVACTGSESASSASGDAGPYPPTDGGSAITGLTPMTWTWVPFSGAHCRDGSTTGIAVNPAPSSDKLLILLEGGGTCASAASCANNPSKYGKPEFEAFVASGPFGMGHAGIMDRSDAANPLRDWNFVYVPYCTGDVHAGNNPRGSVPGVPGMQAFVGYVNVGLYLERVRPTFPGVTQVLLAGVSAGGYGARANYYQVHDAFDPVPVFDLDDSGVPLAAAYDPPCLQGNVATLWGYDKTILARCGADCPDKTNFAMDAAKHLLKTYPGVSFGLLESTDDATITASLGYGTNGCTGTQALSAATFTAALTDMEQELMPYPNSGAFLFAGTDHTTLETAALDTRTAGGVKLTDWLATLLLGTVTNVGP